MSHSDDSLWERIKQTITPINRDDVLSPILGPKKAIKPRKTSQKQVIKEEKQLVSRQNTITKPVSVIDRQTWRKIDKGQIKTQGKLDLHGMTVAQAHQSFISYIKTSAAQGKKYIIVVTGKGNREKGTGVIRRELPIWAQESSVAHHIHSFSEPSKNPGRYILILRKTWDKK